jgi:peptidyl-dipeptidase Dcp
VATKTKALPTRAAKRAPSINPLLAIWRTPFAMPPFARITAAHYAPAFKIAFARHREEIKAIARTAARPSFANTLVALEKSGQLLNRAADVFFNLSGSDSTPELQALERDLAPQFADHQSAIYLDAELFARIEDLFERRDHLKLDQEQARLLDRTYTGFVRAGAQLNAKAKKRVAEINSRLAKLTTQFNQNVLTDEQTWRLSLDSEADLEGLPQGLRDAAARTAADLKIAAPYAITLSRSSVEPFLQFSSRRDLREDAFKAWIRRGEMSAKTDNRALVSEIIGLRLEFAQLMGFRTYADYSLEDTMAKTPEAVRDLLGRVWPAALKRVAEERDALSGQARAEGGNYAVEAWDWRYLSEKLRKARYDLDEGEIRPYLQLDNVIAAAFDTATRLFGLKFEELKDAPRYHPDVRVWEVTAKTGAHVGLFLGDYFARPSKRSGAWMSSFRSQHKLGKSVRPIIVNVMSFARGAQGQPSLLSFDDARTLFHEFGHGLHGLLSDVTYPALSGTNVTRDFVELPSQLYEHWLSRPEVLKKFALHCKTGKPMPDALIARMKAARTFNQGFATVEYTASALVDMELHALDTPGTLDVQKFEVETLSRLGMPREVAMRHRIAHFQHIMGGYAAGYYSYLWSEVMDADAFAAFEESGDVFDAKTAARLKLHIYSAGNRRDPLDAYVAFRGRAPEINSLLKKRGLAAA